MTLACFRTRGYAAGPDGGEVRAMAKITVFDKARLPSRHSTVGPERAPHRSYYYAMGLSKDDIARPFVGVVTTWNEAAPCNIALGRQAQAVKRGVAKAGGTPREFTTITVTDGIAMGHQGMKSSLVSREVIADLTELTVRGHAYDALVGLAGCDKSLPGIMMAMVRLNVPSVFMYGGSILPGRWRGRDVTVQDVFEAVGQHAVGKLSDAELEELEKVACPSAGACGGQFTANTMACVSEAIGLALPGSAGTPAPYEARDKWAEELGEAVMELLRSDLRPRDIVTRKSLENAARVVAASGGSTNGALHLPAIAHECGIDFDLHDVAAIFRETPYIADLKPAGRYVMKDLADAGGVPLLMKALLDGGYLHGDCLTVTGRTDRREPRLRRLERRAGHRPPDQPADHQLGRGRRPQGLAGARGGDRQGGRPQEPEVQGPARVFECEEDCHGGGPGAPLRGGRGPGDPLRGPQGRSRHARDAGRYLAPSTARAWATRWRSSPTAASRAPRAASASAMSAPRPRSVARSACSRTATHRHRRRGRHARRRARAEPNSPPPRGWQPRPRCTPRAPSGNTPRPWAPAEKGAVTHPGGKGEVQVYADI